MLSTELVPNAWERAWLSERMLVIWYATAGFRTLSEKLQVECWMVVSAAWTGETLVFDRYLHENCSRMRPS